jgi:hypothetical protein
MSEYFIFIIFIIFISCADNLTDPPEEDTEIVNETKSSPIEPFYPIPSKSQLEWQDAELIMFIHFGINTFTNKEWGDGTENPSLFNPKNLNCQGP